MEKYRRDQIRGNSEFLSFLKYTSSSNDGQLIQSPVCGFGWKFQAIAGSGASVLEFRFHPDILYNASLGTAQVKATAVFKPKHSSKDVKEETSVVSFTFPTGNRGWHDQVRNGYYTDTSQFIGKYTVPSPTSVYDVFISVQVTFTSLTIDLTPAQNDVDESAEKIKGMLKSLLCGNEVTDIKFYLFSGTDRSGEACAPKAVYANAELLRGHSEILDTLLFGTGHRESQRRELDSKEEARITAQLDPEEYDFDQDSDLEDEGEDEPSWPGQWGITPQTPRQAPLKRMRPPSVFGVGSENAFGGSTLNNSSTLFEDLPSTSSLPSGSPPEVHRCEPSVPNESGESKGSPIDADSVNTANASIKLEGDSEKVEGPRRFGRVIPINGHAHKTWNAFIYYLMTGEVHFLPLTSSLNRESATQKADQDGIVTCSPKSMYHLAQKFGLSELAELSLQGIEHGITNTNVIEEAFRQFSGL
ncbi:hypothetical protein FA15DRAFT_655056 [Coprinopsis marcescibilis]|uniref:MATH domain-containing protein n=1 Tax=Coprinopsis marcescibilis TaxID=230819 RepID=A0A5C3KZ89_COPMA|nr:hypothetical protein FA15DRAFT_655056 [Coprinopsis marcescibilis]